MNVRTLAFVLVAMPAIATQSVAQNKVVQCIKQKMEDAQKKQDIVAISEQGCTTASTSYKFPDGKKYSDCSSNVCWDAPQDLVILSASVVSVSANGSDHRFSQPQYHISVPGGHKRVCASVFARSGGDYGVRGWQKIRISVNAQNTVDPDEMLVFAAECAKS